MGYGKLIQGLLALQIAFPEHLLVEIDLPTELAAAGHALVQLDSITRAVANGDRRAAMRTFFCSYHLVFRTFQMATKIAAIGLQRNFHPAK